MVTDQPTYQAFDPPVMSMYRKQGTSERQTVMTAQKPKFGTFIRERRTAKGYSLRRFAELVGISPTYLSHVEQDKVESPPTADRIQSMAELLGESADELAGMAGRIPDDLAEIIQSQSVEMSALLRAAKGLTARQLRELREHALELQPQRARA
jgi:transcriptional regulator with XRE-family HTH domain